MDKPEPVSDGTMPCPVPSSAAVPCVKRIPSGWTASEGHGGGHFWMSAELARALEVGHYDATAALAGKPFSVHQPADCTPACPKYGRIKAAPAPVAPWVTVPLDCGHDGSVREDEIRTRLFWCATCHRLRERRKDGI